MLQESIDNEVYEEVLKEYWQAEQLYEENCERINKRLMRIIEAVKGSVFLKDLIKLTVDFEIKGAWSFTTVPIGNFQTENYGEIIGVWVDQHGICDFGDMFYGSIFIELKPGKYLKLDFSD